MEQLRFFRKKLFTQLYRPSHLKIGSIRQPQNFNETDMKRIIVVLIAVFVVVTEIGYAQETGPLMMEVELAATLFGVLAGAGVGLISWLTDPGQPTSIVTIMKDGAVLGAFLGALGGYYVLYNASINPNAPPEVDQFDELLEGRNEYDPNIMFPEPKPVARVPNRGFTITLINYKF